MKRFWTWLIGSLPYPDSAYYPWKTNERKWSSARVTIRASQAVYRKRRWFLRSYWYGTIEIAVQVVGLRIHLPFKKGSPHAGKVLYTYEKHLLRRDSDFVFLLRDLSFIEQHCDVNKQEEDMLYEVQEFVLAALPAEHQFDINNYDPEDIDNRMP